MKILGCRKCRPTGRALAERLEASYIEESARTNEDEVIIRYGNGYSHDFGNIINKQEAVALSSNKPLCKRNLLENNIRTPKYYTFEEARSYLSNPGKKLVVRRNGHSQGRWFYVVENPRQLSRYDPNRHYVQELVDKIDEYRLFIMKDRIIEADLKEPPANDPHAMIRNHTHGSFFRWVRVSSLDQDLKNMVRRAVKDVVGLDFAAVDCATIQLPDGRTSSTIFEINSAPGLIDRKLDLFVSKLHELYRI